MHSSAEARLRWTASLASAGTVQSLVRPTAAVAETDAATEDVLAELNAVGRTRVLFTTRAAAGSV